MKIIKRGAEAVLYLKNSKLVKDRIRKKYRIPSIDLRLRRTRTKKEVKLMLEARKWGIPTPQVVSVTDTKITMRFIRGKLVKSALKKADKKYVRKVCKKIGEQIAVLHSHDIIHGDLTTSNMIISDNKIYFIDFGLGEFSKRIEDKAVDLHLLYGALKSTHLEILDVCWKSILNGYKKYKDSNKVLKRLNQIRSRGRYK
jgi:Kae1-associated kinase Bud32